MRRIGANYIITNTGEALKNAYLELDDEGKILEIVATAGELHEVNQLEFYNGVLVPGFVNTHAHLELSYMKGLIEPKRQLPHFIASLRGIRLAAKDKEIQDAIFDADEAMQREGIVLVGDISNVTDSIDCKVKSKIQYHTFVEVFALDKFKAHEVYDNAKSIQTQFEDKGLAANVTPHAPYSVSEKLFSLLNESCYLTNATLSIHNQETPSENEMFIDKTGALVDLFKTFGTITDSFYPTGHNSLPSTLIHMPKCSKINLVHNTYTNQSDIDKALKYSPLIYWTLCPNANLYIEDALPDIPLLHENDLKICLGTDSLASNHQLSILEEMKTIHEHYPEIKFIDMVKWSSYNGADALNALDRFGSFEKGKQPGIVLIENFDFDQFQLKLNSSVKALV